MGISLAPESLRSKCLPKGEAYGTVHHCRPDGPKQRAARVGVARSEHRGSGASDHSDRATRIRDVSGLDPEVSLGFAAISLSIEDRADLPNGREDNRSRRGEGEGTFGKA